MKTWDAKPRPKANAMVDRLPMNGFFVDLKTLTEMIQRPTIAVGLLIFQSFIIPMGIKRIGAEHETTLACHDAPTHKDPLYCNLTPQLLT